MAVKKDFVLAFNRGVISPLAGYRADVKRAGMSAEQQMNWIPRTMGPMSLRPGLEYIGTTQTADSSIKLIPFVFKNNDTALLEVTDEKVRVWVDDELVTVPSVATTITNQTFDTDLTGWTDADQGSAVSDWATGGYMSLTGTGIDRAMRYQQLTIAGGDQGIEHFVGVLVENGSVGIRIGSGLDTDDYVTETQLGRGIHALAFTPTGANVYIVLFNRTKDSVLVNAVTIIPPGILAADTDLLATETLDDIRYAQSGDVIFVARGTTRKPMKIERRGIHSWSMVDYVTDNGPWLPLNATETTMVPSALTGSVTITASQNYFKPSNVGSLFRITSVGQTVTATLGALNDATDAIRVTGVGDTRIFYLAIEGTWTATIDLEQSLVEEGNWTTKAQYTTNQEISFDDGLDNQVAFYRLKVSAYTSGSADADLHIPTGESTGTARVTAYTDPKTVTALVLDDFGSVVPSTDWMEGAWSDRRGFPSAVAFYQGRLFWAGKDKIWGSVTDDFYNFDPETVGDSGPLNRSIGTGPVDSINWLVPLRLLTAGAEGAEHSIRSNSLEEPLTPSNFNVREDSTFGSTNVDPVKIDGAVVFVDRTASRVLQGDSSQDGLETNELTLLTPEMGLPNIKRMAVQRRPDTRVHLVRCDGTVVLMVYDKTEQVNCFVTVETEGLIEDVAVLPGTSEDKVYYAVARVVNGVVVRYLEKWALTTEAEGGLSNKMADSFVYYSGAPTATITGLSHLEGKTVIAWGGGKDLGSYTVSGGSVVLSDFVAEAVVGLPYYALFKSNKLEFLVAGADSLSGKKRIVDAYLALRDVHKQGLEYGTDAAHLDNLPLIEEETAVAADTVHAVYDTEPLLVNGSFSSDTRLILKATAPRPCTVMCAVLRLEGE